MHQLLYKEWFKPLKNVHVHIICWLIFIAYEIVFAAILSSVLQSFVFYSLFYLLNIGTFYFHALIVMKQGISGTITDIWRIPLLVALEIIGYIIMTFVISWIVTKATTDIILSSLYDKRYLATAIYRGVYFILYATGYHFLIRYNDRKELAFKQSIDNEKLRNDLLMAEQDFLRAQINPHLLFNTLSFIKYATRKNPEEATEAIMRLSGIMSFALENNATTIPLSKEIEQVENIIQLNQLRHNHVLYINLVKNIHNIKTPVIPIILLTLVENVIKHGDLRNMNHPAEIYIESTPEQIIFRTTNIPDIRGSIESHHTGLDNITSRLNHFYKEKYRFSHTLEGNIFKAEIIIDYTEVTHVN